MTDELRFDGRVAIVTGAGRGSTAEAVVEEIGALEGEGEADPASVADPDGALPIVIATWGRLDIVVNNPREN